MKYKYRLLKTNTDIIPVFCKTRKKAVNFVSYLLSNGFCIPLEKDVVFSVFGKTAKLLNEPIQSRQYQ